MNARHLAAVAILMAASGCAFVKPQAIPDTDAVDFFSKTGPATADVPSDIAQARRCGQRLNGHANSAESSYAVRTTFAVIGAVLAGAGGGGGGLTAVLSNNTSTQQLGGYLALVGGGVGIVAGALGIFLIDPSRSLDTRAKSIPYYNRAIDTANGVRAAKDEATRASLEAKMIEELRTCIQDGQLPAGLVGPHQPVRQ